MPNILNFVMEIKFPNLATVFFTFSTCSLLHIFKSCSSTSTWHDVLVSHNVTCRNSKIFSLTEKICKIPLLVTNYLPNHKKVIRTFRYITSSRLSKGMPPYLYIMYSVSCKVVTQLETS